MPCLETDFLVALNRNQKDAIAKLKALYASGSELTITPISAYELMFGAYKSGSEQRVAHAEEIIKAANMLEFDFYAAKEAGKISHELEKSGGKIGDMDTLTAAIALRHGEEIITRNTKHFGKVKGLGIEKW